MDILSELAENFMITLDSALLNDSGHLKATMQLHEYLEHELSPDKSANVEEIVTTLTSATFNAGIKAGLRLGAKIAVGLIGGDK